MEILIYSLLLLFFLSPLIINYLPEKEETKNWNMLNFKLCQICDSYCYKDYFDYFVVSGTKKRLNMTPFEIIILQSFIIDKAREQTILDKHMDELTDNEKFISLLKYSLREPEKNEYRRYSSKPSFSETMLCKQKYDQALSMYKNIPNLKNYINLKNCFNDFYNLL